MEILFELLETDEDNIKSEVDKLSFETKIKILFDIIQILEFFKDDSGKPHQVLRCCYVSLTEPENISKFIDKILECDDEDKLRLIVLRMNFSSLDLVLSYFSKNFEKYKNNEKYKTIQKIIEKFYYDLSQDFKDE